MEKFISPSITCPTLPAPFWCLLFEKSAILTIDGVGEWATATKGVGIGTNINLTHQIDFPHSLGLLYSAFTYYTWFQS